MAGEIELFDSQGNKVIAKAASKQLVDLAGKPLKRSPKPVGVYSNLYQQRTAGLVKYGVDNALNSPEVRNPLLNIINFFMPYNYKVLAQWIRYYDKFHPMVGNCLDLHGSFPISKFDLKLEHEDDEILDIYKRCVEEIDLFNRLLEISREYELLGEVFPYIHWNDDLGFPDAMILLNPDFIHVDMHPLAFGKNVIIKLEPDELLKSIATSNNPEDVEIRQEMDPMVIAAVLTGQNIRLDSFNVCQIARKSSPYEPRGTSIVLRCLKDLMYEDKLREAQYAISDGMITPKTIYKLGDIANGYLPNESELHEFRLLLQSQAHDPLSALVTHSALNVEYVGYTGKILPVVPEFQFVEDRILTALYTNKALTHGEGPTYANASIAMEALQGRYMAKREKLEELMRNKLFLKIAYHNEFYEPLTEAQQAHGVRPSKKDRKFALPTFEWKQKLKLVEDMQKKAMIIALRNSARGIPEVSLRKIHDLLDLDHDDEMRAIQEESKIIKQIQQDYGVSTPLLGAKPMQGTPSQIPTMNSSGRVDMPKAPQQMRLPGTPTGNKDTVQTKEPGGQMQTKEPGTTASARRRDGAWKSTSLKTLINDPTIRRPVIAQRPDSFFEENGRLKEFSQLVEAASNSLEESALI